MSDPNPNPMGEMGGKADPASQVTAEPLPPNVKESVDDFLEGFTLEKLNKLTTIEKQFQDLKNTTSADLKAWKEKIPNELLDADELEPLNEVQLTQIGTLITEKVQKLQEQQRAIAEAEAKRRATLEEEKSRAETEASKNAISSPKTNIQHEVASLSVQGSDNKPILKEQQPLAPTSEAQKPDDQNKQPDAEKPASAVLSIRQEPQLKPASNNEQSNIASLVARHENVTLEANAARVTPPTGSADPKQTPLYAQQLGDQPLSPLKSESTMEPIASLHPTQPQQISPEEIKRRISSVNENQLLKTNNINVVVTEKTKQGVFELSYQAQPSQNAPQGSAAPNTVFATYNATSNEFLVQQPKTNDQEKIVLICALLSAQKAFHPSSVLCNNVSDEKKDMLRGLAKEIGVNIQFPQVQPKPTM